jgi:hypothetical protein
MTTPAGFLEFEVPVPHPPAKQEMTEIRCVRTGDVAEIKPTYASAEHCRIKVVFGTKSEEWYVLGTYTQVKERIARSQQLVALGSVASELTELETRALDLLAEIQQASTAQVLRWALEHYARSTLPKQDFDRFYFD